MLQDRVLNVIPIENEINNAILSKSENKDINLIKKHKKTADQTGS